MASFISAGYKTPLAAAVFVAETSGGHSYIIPTLIGAAIAYAVSGEASASGDQRLHQVARVSELSGLKVADVMQPQVVGVQAASTLRAFAESIAAHHRHTVYPVFDGTRTVGAAPIWALTEIPTERWDQTRVSEIADPKVSRVTADTDLDEALRLLTGENAPQVLLVTSRTESSADPDTETLAGIATKTDILLSLRNGARRRTRQDKAPWPLQQRNRLPLP
jgi:CIC family chloride channel protein